MSVKDIIEAVKMGAEAVNDVLKPVQEIGGAMWDAAARHAEHGASELAGAMFNGNAYVPYGWSGVESAQEVEVPKDVKPWEQEKTQEVRPQEREQENQIEM